MQSDNETLPCLNAGKWIGGCKFEARYDKVEPDSSLRRIANYSSTFSPWFIEKLRVKKTYVHDVCVRCGKTIER
jgi:hypothetical protein